MIDHPILHDLARFGVRLGLDRVRGLLDSLGSPHRDYPVIHVAGTNGKGSVVRMIASMLRAQGLHVGALLSPHLQRVNERILIDGEEISDDDLNELLATLDRARRAWARTELAGEVPPERVLTFFEMLTAAGFLHLSRVGVDVAVVEVGLGGRLDATNVVDPLVSVITSVGIDHTAQLGCDLSSIAWEKAGIVKPDRPVVVGPLVSDAARVVRAVAQERGAPVWFYDQDFRVHADTRPGVFTWSREDVPPLRDLFVPLGGGHQVENAGVAVAAVQRLPERLRPSTDAIRQGLASSVHAGRMEWLTPRLLTDCAHNPAGAARLATVLGEVPRDRRRTLLLGMSREKDARSVAVALASSVDRVLTTRSAHPRAADPGELAGALVDLGIPVLPAGPIEDALPLARSGDDLVVVAGSVFLVGAVRDLLGVR